MTDKKISIFEKMMKLGDLMNAARNKDLMDTFKKLEGGERLYEIFLIALNDEVEELMGIKKDDISNQVMDLSATTNDLTNRINQLAQTINIMSSTSLIEVLNIINEKLLPTEKPQVASSNSHVAAPQVPIVPLGPANPPPVTKKYTDEATAQKIKNYADSRPNPRPPIAGAF